MGVMGVAGVGVGGCSDSDAGVAPVWPPFLVAAAFCRSVSAMVETHDNYARDLPLHSCCPSLLPASACCSG